MKRSIVYLLVFLLTAVIVLSSCEPENGASVSENISSEVSNEEVSDEIKDDASVDVSAESSKEIQNETSQDVTAEIPTETSNLLDESSEVIETRSVITVSQEYPEVKVFALSAVDTTFITELWENEWLYDITKTYCPYEFELDGMIIKYSNEAGLFNDYENERHMILTKEQTQAVNKMLGIE